MANALLATRCNWQPLLQLATPRFNWQLLVAISNYWVPVYEGLYIFETDPFLVNPRQTAKENKKNLWRKCRQKDPGAREHQTKTLEIWWTMTLFKSFMTYWENNYSLYLILSPHSTYIIQLDCMYTCMRQT